MKDTIIKNLHVFIFLYTAFINFELYEQKTEEVESLKGVVASTEARLARSRTELAKVDQFNKDLESSRQRVAEVVNEIERVQKQLPSEINDTEVQQILTGISSDLRMQNPNMVPKSEVPQGFYFSKDFDFSAKATFLQSLIFFEKLENLSKSNRILNVKYVKIFDDPEADKRSQFRGLQLATNIESYRYNTSFKVEAPTPDVDAPEGAN